MKRLLLLIAITFLWLSGFPQATKTLINTSGVYTITPNQYVLAADTFYFAAIGDTTNTLLGKTRASQIYCTKATAALKIAISDTASLVLGKTRAGQIYATKTDNAAKLNASDTTNIVLTYTDVVNTAYVYAADGGSTDAYAITIPGFKAYVQGQVVVFKANTINTGACSLVINALTVIPLKVLSDQDPVDGWIEAGQMITCIYDGTNFQVLNGDSNP